MTPPPEAMRPPTNVSASRSSIRSQDLTSLPVLRALLRECSVTRAGETVGLSQPATSNALGRLRRRFGDELLVRAGRRYELTPLAESLLQRAEHAFDALERLFEERFDPSTSTREFTLALSDYSLAVLGGSLVAQLRREAPGVRLSFRQLSTASADFDEALRQSDGLILPPDYVRGHPSLPLIHDQWVCLVGDQASVGDAVTTEDLGRLPWVSPFGRSLTSSAPPVRQLRALGHDPRIDVSVESFQALPSLVANTDRIAFIPARLARLVTPVRGARVLPSPLPMNEHLLSLFWDPIETNDAGHLWFRRALADAARAAMQDEPS